MRFGGEQVGRWGIALMAVTGVAGIGLAVHGWSARGAAVTPALASGSGSASAPAARTPSAASSVASTGPQAGPSAAPSPAASTAAGPGPLLSSEPYASAAFLIWPGTPSAAARQALTGLKISVHKQGSGVSVTAGVAGQPAQSRVYPGGARVYVIEASMGDDSNNSDYSLGDDGLVVTDSKGRIVQ